MSPEPRFILLAAALVCFAAAAIVVNRFDPVDRVRVIALGLALALLPFVWDAAEVAFD